MITKTLFDNYNGRDVYLYELKNEEIKVGITDFGAAVQYIRIGGVEAAGGYPAIEDRLSSGTYCGATIGRVANRIKGGTFTLGGREYRLSVNEGKNHLHGGAEGFDKRFYEVEIGENSLTLSLMSKDGDMGYGGNLNFRVKFEIKGAGLNITYSAVSDRDTLWCPTCHTYFNLGEKGIDDILLKINADKFTPIDEELIPTGEIKSVKNTPFDFRELKPIGRDIGADDIQLKLAGGYDHSYILRGEGAAAEAYSPENGIKLSVFTDMPALQFYSGNFIKGEGRHPRDSFCLEPQFTPNAVNVKSFEPPYLPGDTQKTHFINYYFQLV